MTRRILNDALQLGAQGYPVFPCRMDKRPACTRGFYDAVTDAAAIEELWRLYPGALVGVPTGIIFDALDIDAKHEAARSWWHEHQRHMRREHELPRTRAHRTRSGGLHLLFQQQSALRCSAGKLAPGVDTRGAGGYIIWWPAAGYQVLTDAPLAPWPDWLLAEFAPKVQATRQTTSGPQLRGDGWLRGLARTVAAAAEGRRNSTLFWAACRAGEAVRDGKAAEAFVVDVLIESARHAGLPPLEAQRTINSGMRGRL
jgi:hypothetical protein